MKYEKVNFKKPKGMWKAGMQVYCSYGHNINQYIYGKGVQFKLPKNTPLTIVGKYDSRIWKVKHEEKNVTFLVHINNLTDEI